MANFIQYWARKDTVYCLFYVCGEEVCLQEMVLQQIRKTVNPDPMDSYSLSGTDKVADIMSTLVQEPVTSKKLVVLRNAHKMKQFDRVVTWAKKISDFRETCLVVQTNEKKVKTGEDTYRPFVEQGLFVECKPLSEAKLFDWSQNVASISKEGSRALLEWVGWDLSRYLNELRKMRYLDREIQPEDVGECCTRTYDERFVGMLMVGDKKEAANALTMITQDMVSSIVGLLEYKLSILFQLATMRKAKVAVKDAAIRLGLPIFVVVKDWQTCLIMPVLLIRKRLSLLVYVDSHVKQGDVGILESLLVQW